MTNTEVKRSIRAARADELEAICGIYAHARSFMAEVGNPDQWGTVYPPVELLKQDIAAGKLYVCEEDGELAGVFYFAVEDDPTYRVIDGAWPDDEPYGVVHRIAAAEGRRGVGAFCIGYALERCGNLRIDTHRDNKPMQSLLRKLGFRSCGVITVEDGTPRDAFSRRVNN